MFRTLSKEIDYVLPTEIQQQLIQFEYSFNPSLVSTKDKKYLAVRVCREQGSQIEALIYTWSDSKQYTLLNLSDWCDQNLNILKVADPKLFISNEEVYFTFNTGHTADVNNDIYLGKLLEGKIETLKKCVFDKRNKIEKNWAFYFNEDLIHVVYSISPLIILKETRFNDDFEIHFEKVHQSSCLSNNYSIGTQMVELQKGSYALIAHKKRFINGKRLYFGIPLIYHSNYKQIKITGKKYWIHSFLALLGSKFKFNPNLISCTYFSGIDKNEGEILISYGVNDIEMHIKKINLKYFKW